MSRTIDWLFSDDSQMDRKRESPILGHCDENPRKYESLDDYAKGLGEWYRNWLNIAQSCKKNSKRRPSDLQEYIHNLKTTERIFSGKNDKLKEAIQQERQEAERALALLTYHATPPGNQRNYMLNYCVWCMANEVLEKKHKKNWKLVADLISKYFPVKHGWSADDARQLYKDFESLRSDPVKRFKILSATLLNAGVIGEALSLPDRPP